MKIKPRKSNERGGIITMPLKVNVPDPNDNSWEEIKPPRMWSCMLETPASKRVQRRYV